MRNEQCAVDVDARVGIESRQRRRETRGGGAAVRAAGASASRGGRRGGSGGGRQALGVRGRGGCAGGGRGGRSRAGQDKARQGKAGKGREGRVQRESRCVAGRRGGSPTQSVLPQDAACGSERREDHGRKRNKADEEGGADGQQRRRRRGLGDVDWERNGDVRPGLEGGYTWYSSAMYVGTHCLVERQCDGQRADSTLKGR